jgi:hypothetical protein
MGIRLGGETCWLKRKTGDLLVFFEWWDNERDVLGQGEPTMFIGRAARVALSGNRGAAVLPMQQAHYHVDSKTGGPTRHAIEFAKGACDQLGLEPSRMNVFKIASAIADNIPDLLRMPPEPSPDKFASRKAKPIGEVKVVLGGETIVEDEIRH